LSKKINFSYKIPADTKSEQLKEMFKIALNDEECGPDFTFIVNGTEIKAHTLILNARWQHFKLLMGSGMKEAQTKQLIVDDVSPELFKIMLEYIYSDSVNISPEDAIELLKLADRFGLNRLKQMCDFLIESAFDFKDLSSILGLLQVADIHQVPNLKNICLYILVFEFGIATVKDDPSWQMLSSDLQNEIDYYNELRNWKYS